MNIIKLKLNCDIAHYKMGEIISVDVDKHGVALDVFWRRRMIDAKFDKCCEVLTHTAKSDTLSHKSKLIKKDNQ